MRLVAATSNAIASVGSTEISVEEYQATYGSVMNNLARRFGRRPTAEEARLRGIDRAVLDDLVNGATLDNQARSLGMSTATIYSRILLPSAIRRALPQYGNELVMVMHATSIASAVTIVELTRTARDVYYNHLAPFEAFGLVAVFYFVITFALVGLVKLLEGRFLRHLRPMSTPSKAA